eukprot:GGOE01041035.1.p2 GENE.GGOE01041035.1~~GGOE01041035.1.p2  ORF type:complete len:243 (-),score=69.19 GGOE01041035.1:248-976(-)
MPSGVRIAALAVCGAAGLAAALQPWHCHARDESTLQQIKEQLDRIERHLGVERPSPPVTKQPVESWADGSLQGQLFSASQIRQEVRRMAKQVSHDYRGKDLVVVGLMSGVFILMADFVREIDIPHEVQFIAVSSYGKDSTVSSGNVKIKKDLDTPVVGRHVLLLDEICDSGNTLACLEALLLNRGAASVRSCVLLDKVSRRAVPIQPQYVGMVCPDEFVVGYGMDFKDQFRSLPFIGVLKHH